MELIYAHATPWRRFWRRIRSGLLFVVRYAVSFALVRWLRAGAIAMTGVMFRDEVKDRGWSEAMSVILAATLSIALWWLTSVSVMLSTGDRELRRRRAPERDGHALRAGDRHPLIRSGRHDHG